MRRFLPKFILLITIILGNVAIYYVYVDPLITQDLAAIRKIPVGTEYAEKIHKQYPFSDTAVVMWNKNDIISKGSIIVIGDSFSNRTERGQQDAGQENSWTSFCAQTLQKKIVNIRNYDCGFNPEQLFISMKKANIIPDSCLVIIESVERQLIQRLTSPLYKKDYLGSYLYGLYRIDSTHKERKKDWVAETTTFLRFRIGRECPVHKFSLSKPCFSHNRYDTILFSYYQDEDNIHPNITSIYPLMRSTLDSLFLVANQHHITLLYMIAADKYDAYEPLIKDPHKVNHLLEYFPSNDSIVNTKELLLPFILGDTPDIYRLDDTHWSPVGSKIVGEEIAKRILKKTTVEP